jgi:hypothetical protein
MSEDERWIERLIGLYEYAKKGYLRQLNGDRPKEWNGEGLHVWSHLWGQLDATAPAWLSDGMAEAPDLLRIGPKQLSNVAYADAVDEFRERLYARASGAAQA